VLSERVGAERTTPCSLANVLRLRRPFVVVDEAHNSRTELAFDMLARFRPSGVMELTATPDLERTPSNVLHSVSAAELKADIPEVFNERHVLDGAGRVSNKQADAHAESEYEQFAAQRRALLEAEGAELNVRVLENAAKALPTPGKNRT
jgi:superfamily II DNA or RNA helicase